MWINGKWQSSPILLLSEKSMYRGAEQAAVHGITESWTHCVTNFHFQSHMMDPSLWPNFLSKTSHPNTIPLQFGLQYTIWGKNIHSVHSTECLFWVKNNLKVPIIEIHFNITFSQSLLFVHITIIYNVIILYNYMEYTKIIKT